MIRALLQAPIQDELSKNALSLSSLITESVPLLADPDLRANLRYLAKQIDAKANEIIANASILIETFDLDTQLPPLFDLNYLNHSLFYDDNFALESFTFDGASWMQDVNDEMTAIESWEDNSKNLSLLVMSDFDVRRKTSSAVKHSAFETKLALYDELNANERNPDVPVPPVDGHLHRSSHDPIWDGVYAETSPIPTHVSLDVIKDTQLKSYLLKTDNQRDVIVSKKERKTRRHIGIIDPGTLLQNVCVNGRVDHTAVFSYNLGAVSQLAILYEDVSTKLSVISTFINQDSAFQSKLRQLKETFQNPRQLALDVAALESEAGLKRIELMSQRLLHSINLNLTLSRHSYMEASVSSKDASAERMDNAEHEYKSARESHLDHADAFVSATLAYLGALDNMKGIYTSASRELLEMIEAAAIDANVAQEVIQEEAKIEREHEFVSINHIKLLGNAHIEEVTQSIEKIFLNLAACFHHVIATSAGRRQFFFYIGVMIALVLILSTIKEIMSLGCVMFLRLLVTPRLVREYGNSRFRMRWSEKAQIAIMRSIILPENSKERIEHAVKIATFARKGRFPMRNILLFGKPGCGKSFTAKAIAQSIPSLPYALMSGADLFPMGSQGPSELRRLLSWANNNGGVIIIDEAESALGKRGKAVYDDEQQHDFSRDCLNVLLSLTGTTGNIMLILTTTSPGELDDAVLDRMDEIIHLPSLTSTERCDLLSNRFFQLFEKETEHPILSFKDRMLRTFRRVAAKARYDVKFDVSRSLSDLANADGMERFSGRELEKLLQHIAYKTSASDSGVLTQALFDFETIKLVEAFSSKHRCDVKHKVETETFKKKLQPVSTLDTASNDNDVEDEYWLDYLKETRTKQRAITRSVSKLRHTRTPLAILNNNV